MSKREDAVVALHAALATTGAECWRGTDTAREIPNEGLVELAEGDDVLEPILSPLSYAHELGCTLYVAIEAEDENARDEALDQLLGKIDAAVTLDRTLGGAVEYLEIGAPTFDVAETDGAGKSAFLTVNLYFTTLNSPLS